MTGALPTPRERWQQYCIAALNVRARFGSDAAIDYLIGEKLLSFAQLAEQHAEFLAELPSFVGAIRERYAAAEILAHFRRAERASHVEADIFDGADEDESEDLRAAFDEERRLRDQRAWLEAMLLGRGA